MLKINKKVEYALMALKFMADKSQEHIEGDAPLISAREVCDKFNTPFDTTAKVMQIMNNQDLLKSTKGIKGGYSLNKDLSLVSYMNLVEMIEGKIAGSVCISNKGTCELIGKCNITTPVELLNKKMNAFLESLTLADLLHGVEFNPEHKNAFMQMNSTEKTV
ncbi:MAG: Rrf2 family transcriptional regulator [Bacteriovorax sp.]|jgi:Rrf2 family protein